MRAHRRAVKKLESGVIPLLKQARVVVVITLAPAAQQAAGTDRYNSRNRGYYSLKARPPRFP